MTKRTQAFTRRDLLALTVASVTARPMLGASDGRQGDGGGDVTVGTSTQLTAAREQGAPMRLHYLEIVTTDVDATCALYAQLYGVTFGEADRSLGGARTARLETGGTVGVRAPMHGGERPVTRPYVLVGDIDAAVAAATKAGAEIAVPPMKIAGHGTCAIFFHGGVEAGLWQV